MQEGPNLSAMIFNLMESVKCELKVEYRRPLALQVIIFGGDGKFIDEKRWGVSPAGPLFEISLLYGEKFCDQTLVARLVEIDRSHSMQVRNNNNCYYGSQSVKA